MRTVVDCAASRGSMSLDAPHTRREPQRRHPLVVGRSGDVGAKLGDELVEIERLGDVVGGTQLHQRDRALDRAVAGDEDPRRDVQLLGLQLLEEIIAVAVGQPDVAHHDVVAFRLEIARSTLRRFVPIAAQSFEREAIDERFSHDVVVFDETDLAVVP